ncbi:hypothetical protein GCM10011519_32680 [Marmoricola endophyticus]|uniref:Uncharacterized protein n=1 Tax=Marmoricola endophyticus TaxID=2040280 RepID=A0A917BTG4_9ACTN|nr:hypothetical protein GCM10011519_32680 [Marmoricola endophyticus]
MSANGLARELQEERHRGAVETRSHIGVVGHHSPARSWVQLTSASLVGTGPILHNTHPFGTFFGDYGVVVGVVYPAGSLAVGRRSGKNLPLPSSNAHDAPSRHCSCALSVVLRPQGNPASIRRV